MPYCDTSVKTLIKKVKNIKLILFDVDGVFCSRKLTYLNNGVELKTFDIHDGMGIKLAQMAGIKTGIITARKSSILKRRTKELKIAALFSYMNYIYL